MLPSYDEVRRDHEYLWKIGPARDMTGGYVDQDDLKCLLERPTKACARDCYLKQIGYWFQVGPDVRKDDWTEDREVEAIARAYGYEFERDMLIDNWSPGD